MSSSLSEVLDIEPVDYNAILRGAQLTLVGAARALQNPGLWNTQHYRQAGIAVACGIAIRLLIEIPVLAVRISLWVLGFFISLDAVTWDDALVDGLRFLQTSVLQVPLLVMTLLRHVTPALDDLFMQSLRWVDYTYAQKHGPAAVAAGEKGTRYCQNLCAYAEYTKSQAHAHANNKEKQPSSFSLPASIKAQARRTGISLAVWALSFLPLVGPLVLPAASFWTFRRAVGTGPALAVFATTLLFFSKRHLVIALQTYYGQRSLVRGLLAPYLSRVRFTPAQKLAWFRSREAILFGFGTGFFLLVRIPLLGVLVYGLAEASTAYLVTKITDPPPFPPLPPSKHTLSSSSSFSDAAASATAPAAATATPAELAAYPASQIAWRNKKAFLDLALDNLDALQVKHQQLKQQKQAKLEHPQQEDTAHTAGSQPLADAAAELRHRVDGSSVTDGSAPPPYTS